MTKRKSLSEKKLLMERMDSGANVAALSRESGVSRMHLYRMYRAWKAHGAEGLAPGRLVASRTDAPKPVGRLRRTGGRPETDAERIAALERKVAQQALELDFFKTTLRHVEAARQAAKPLGVSASTPPSGSGRSGKVTERMGPAED